MPADGHGSQEMFPLKRGLLGFLYIHMERQDIIREGVWSYVNQSLHRSCGNIFVIHGLWKVGFNQKPNHPVSSTSHSHMEE